MNGGVDERRPLRGASCSMPARVNVVSGRCSGWAPATGSAGIQLSSAGQKLFTSVPAEQLLPQDLPEGGSTGLVAPAASVLLTGWRRTAAVTEPTCRVTPPCGEPATGPLLFRLIPMAPAASVQASRPATSESFRHGHSPQDVGLPAVIGSRSSSALYHAGDIQDWHAEYGMFQLPLPFSSEMAA